MMKVKQVCVEDPFHGKYLRLPMSQCRWYVQKKGYKIKILVMSMLFLGQQAIANQWIGNNLPSVTGTYQGNDEESAIVLNVDNRTAQDSSIVQDTLAKGGVPSADNGVGLQINGNNKSLTSITNNGSLQGGSDDINNSMGGKGIEIKDLTLQTFTNNSTIVGGKGNFGGDAFSLDKSTITTFMNKGIIKGGERGTSSGSAIAINNNSNITIQNEKSGVILGGDSANPQAKAGSGVYLDGSNNNVKLHNEGIVQAGKYGAAGVYLDSNSGTIQIINSGLISKGEGSAAVVLNTSNNSIELQTGGKFDGDLVAAANNQTFIFNANKESGEHSFDLSSLKGAGWSFDENDVTKKSIFRKIGEYDWILTGQLDSAVNNTKWQVDAGNLVIGSSTTEDSTLLRGRIDINNSATLSGFGTVTGVVNINSGATITPGYHSVGTMHVGQINFASNSTYLVDADYMGTDSIIVDNSNNSSADGKAHIDEGSKVEVQAGKGWKVGDYKILSTQQGVDGQFSGVHTNLAFLDASVEKRNTDHEIWLTLTRNKTGFVDIAVSRNQRQTANALELLADNNRLKEQVIGLSSTGAINAYNNLNGEIHASVQTALLNDRYVRDAINEHLIDRFETQGSGLWVTSWGAAENLGSDNNAAKISNNVFGFMVGADSYLNASTQAGLALGYQHNNINLNKGRQSDAEVDSYHMAGYLAKHFNYDINLRGGLDYAYLNIRTDRSVQVGKLSESNKDSYHGNLVQGFIEVSKALKVNDQLKFEPYLNIAHVYMDAKFNEGKNATALRGSGDNQVTFSTSGIKTKIKMTEKVKMSIGAGWQHAYGNRQVNTDMKFKGSDYFNINGVPITKDATIADIGLVVNVTSSTNIIANYQGQFGNKVESNAAKVGFNYKF